MLRIYVPLGRDLLEMDGSLEYRELLEIDGLLELIFLEYLDKPDLTLC